MSEEKDTVEVESVSENTDNESLPFAIEPFKTTVQILRHYGSFFIICCIRYLNVHTERVVDDFGGYQPRSASFGELLQAVTGQRAAVCNEWLEENHIPPLQHCDDMIVVMREYIRSCVKMTAETEQGKDILTIESLRQTFQLSEFEMLVMITCALIQYDALYAHAYRYVTGAERDEMPAADFFIHLYEDLIEDEAELRSCFGRESSLLRYSLISLKMKEVWEDNTPLSLAGVSIPRRLLDYILGDKTSFLPDACKLLSYAEEDIFSLDAQTEEALNIYLEESCAHIGLLGYRGLGRASALCCIARRLFMPVVELDFYTFCRHMIQTSDDVSASLSVVLREIRLRRAILLIRFDEMDSETSEWLTRHAHQFYEVLSKDNGVKYAVLLTRQTILTRRIFGELTEVQFPSPSRDKQPQYWYKALSRMLPEETAKDVSSILSSGYCLSYDEINAAIEQTLTRLNSQSPQRVLTAENISETLNKTRGQSLEGMATMRSTSLYLKDIVLSDDIRKTLDEILSYARYSETVMQDWGFAKYNSSGGGLSVLLSGVPGTGKTLTALVLAHELGRALYVVDLSRVVDKYIGETEKKLSIIFDEAERSQAMLLFDEADSLFAKRTDVKSSNDRYANLEVNYLLQRLEAYRGVSILTTNFGGGLDEALARRIQFKVHFPMPDAKQRAELWNRLIPPGAPRSNDIDLDSIAQEFEMSGGHIKNAIFRASILCASSGHPIDNETLWDAAVHEYRSMGHIIRDVDDLG